MQPLKATFEEFKRALGSEYNKNKGKVAAADFEGILKDYNFENSVLRRSSLKTDLENDGFFKENQPIVGKLAPSTTASLDELFAELGGYSYELFSNRGKPVKELVDDVGSYFPFVNRDQCLKFLWKRLVKSIDWARKSRGNPDSYKLEGSEYIAICGTSGLGKTTFATDGLLRISECIKTIDPSANDSHVSLLKQSIKNGTIFRVSYADIQIMHQELLNPSLSIALRVLYGYLNLLKRIDPYYPKFFLSMEKSSITLHQVLQYIGKNSQEDEKLIVIHIDETQNLINVNTSSYLEKHKGFLYQQLQELWNIMDSKTSPYLFVMLSGTNALNLYDQFLTSNFRYIPINLPLLAPKHFENILNSIMDNKVLIPPQITNFFHLATAGHPRLFKAIITIASIYFVTEESVPTNKQSCFNPTGFKTFLELNSIDQLWKILEKTYHNIIIYQFPEISKAVICKSQIRQEILVRLLSDKTEVNRRDTINSFSDVKWGDLEDKGGVFLGRMEDEGSNISGGKLPDKTKNEISSGNSEFSPMKSETPATKNKISPNLNKSSPTKNKSSPTKNESSPTQNKSSPMQLENLEIHVPLIFTTAYTSSEFQMQEEPLLSYIHQLNSDANEVQDVAVVMNSLWIYHHYNPVQNIDLAKAVHIPGLKEDIFTVTVPEFFKISSTRYKITDVELAAAQRNKLEEQLKDSVGEVPYHAFINGETAAWGDGYIFLKLVNDERWLCIIVQSKRKAVGFGKTDTQLQSDLEKVFKKKTNEEAQQMFAEHKFVYLYLYITDSTYYTPATFKYDHVYVVTRAHHTQFYGTYRTLLKYLRDQPPLPKNKELEAAKKKLKEKSLQDEYCNCKSKCMKNCSCKMQGKNCVEGRCHLSNNQCTRKDQSGEKRKEEEDKEDLALMKKKQKIKKNVL